VIFQDPSRQPSADVVVVAGADGAEPGGGAAALLGADAVAGSDGPEVEDPVPVGDAVSPGAVVTAGPALLDPVGDEPVGVEPGDSDCPQTAPAMSPTTAVRASAASTIAAAGMDPRSARG
jgi:hypothetical protein